MLGANTAHLAPPNTNLTAVPVDQGPVPSTGTNAVASNGIDGTPIRLGIVVAGSIGVLVALRALHFKFNIGVSA